MNAFLQKVVSTMEGPFLLGNEISLADILIYPWFERWAIIEHFFNFPMPKEYGKINVWLQKMNERPSVIETKKLTNDKYYV